MDPSVDMLFTTILARCEAGRTLRALRYETAGGANAETRESPSVRRDAEANLLNMSGFGQRVSLPLHGDLASSLRAQSRVQTSDSQ